MSDMPQDFEAMKARLDEIADEVSVEGISLDDALALYEEAVKLGLAACDVSEADILVLEETGEGIEGAAEDAEAVVDGAVVAGSAQDDAIAVAVADAVESAEGVEAVAVEVVAPAESEENNF